MGCDYFILITLHLRFTMFLDGNKRRDETIILTDLFRSRIKPQMLPTYLHVPSRDATQCSVTLHPHKRRIAKKLFCLIFHHPSIITGNLDVLLLLFLFYWSLHTLPGLLYVWQFPGMTSFKYHVHLQAEKGQSSKKKKLGHLNALIETDRDTVFNGHSV